MPKRTRTPANASPLHHALTRIGDKWSLLLIAALLDGPRRFGDLLEAVPGIAPNILSQRLRHLEREALVVARPYSERPPRHTECGTPLQVRWWCPSCQEPVDDPEAEDVRVV